MKAPKAASCAHPLWVILVLLTPWRCVKAQSYTCDESKCRGQRIHPWVDDDTEYTCWVKAPSWDISMSEEMAAFELHLLDPTSGYCADGFVGRLVKSVPEAVIDGELRSWFTCCPPDSDYAGIGDETKEVYQTCSDTACSSPDWAGGGNCWADGFQEPMSCGSSAFRYPRFTGLQSLIYVQFVCCDKPQEEDPFMEQLILARIIWVILSSITLLVCSVFIVAICRNKKARSEGYNLYLVFLAIPDAIANLMILLRNALAMSGAPVSPTVFIFVASFEYFYAASNMWLNAVIVGQIHSVLRRSSKYTKIPPPSVHRVCKQTAIVYAFSAVVFGWAFFMYIHGLNTFSLAEVVNVWIATRVVVMAPPILYVLGICWDVWYNERLPISGRTRVLALYFLRVIVVFLFTWVPYYILYEVSWNVTHNRWMVYTSYYLSSVQGTISVMVALSKPDVKRVFWDFIYGLFSPKSEKPSTQQAGDERGDTEECAPPSGENEDAPNPPRRFFGGATAADDLWNEDDVWGTDDLLEAVMAGDVPASEAVLPYIGEKAAPAGGSTNNKQEDSTNGGDWFQRYSERVKRQGTSSFSDENTSDQASN